MRAAPATAGWTQRRPRSPCAPAAPAPSGCGCRRCRRCSVVDRRWASAAASGRAIGRARRSAVVVARRTSLSRGRRCRAACGVGESERELRAMAHFENENRGAGMAGIGHAAHSLTRVTTAPGGGPIEAAIPNKHGAGDSAITLLTHRPCRAVAASPPCNRRRSTPPERRAAEVRATDPCAELRATDSSTCGGGNRWAWDGRRGRR